MLGSRLDGWLDFDLLSNCGWITQGWTKLLVHYYIILYYIISYHIISYHIIYHITSHHIIYILYYIILYYIILYYIIYHISYRIIYHIYHIIYHIILYCTGWSKSLCAVGCFGYGNELLASIKCGEFDGGSVPLASCRSAR